MFTALILTLAVGQVAAQNVRPQIGYIYPTGGRPGTTVEVQLGAYDWTPDTHVFVHDPRLKLEVTGPAGPFLLTPPPYWFGTKASLAQPPLAREVPGKITIPQEFPAGVVRWQVANANGGSNAGIFVVSQHPHFTEPEFHESIIDLPSIPLAISGRLSKVSEVDTFRIPVTAAGMISCTLEDRLGQPFQSVMTVRNPQGRVIADTANTTGQEQTVVRWHAEAGNEYLVSVHDVNFGGDRGYVYRMTIEQSPSVTATIPCVIARGQMTPVKFVGWGIATGKLELELLQEHVTVPDSATEDTYEHLLNTPCGPVSVRFALAASSDSIEPDSTELADRHLASPCSISASISELDSATLLPLDRYSLSAKKGDSLRITAEAGGRRSLVDPALVILSSTGAELARADDQPESVDALLDFTVPEDGDYQLIVADHSGTSPSPAHVYRLRIESQEEAADFTIEAPDRLEIPLGGQADLVVKTFRRGNWNEPITLTLENLPPGVQVAETASSAATRPPVKAAPTGRAKKAGPKDSKLTLTAADNVAADARLVTLTATASIDGRKVVQRSQPLLLVKTLKTRCKVKSAVQDGGRIVNRGTTYPADVIVERLEGYEGPVQLQMAATQQRQRRGIVAPELLVPSGVSQVQYPVFMPEWLETSLTARMNVIGITPVTDPVGNVRYVTGIMDGFIVMSLEGALLKLTHEPQERRGPLGGSLEIPLKISRSVKLAEEVRIELVEDASEPGLLQCEPIKLSESASIGSAKGILSDDRRFLGERTLKFRATALKENRWPVISETTVAIMVVEN